MAYFYTYLFVAFQSKNTNLKFLTSVSVNGWSNMAKLHKFDLINLILP